MLTQTNQRPFKILKVEQIEKHFCISKTNLKHCKYSDKCGGRSVPEGKWMNFLILYWDKQFGKESSCWSSTVSLTCHSARRTCHCSQGDVRLQCATQAATAEVEVRWITDSWGSKQAEVKWHTLRVTLAINAGWARPLSNGQKVMEDPRWWLCPWSPGHGGPALLITPQLIVNTWQWLKRT